MAAEAVALQLLATPIQGSPYHEAVAYDAVVAKFQQAAELALKAAVLALSPERSDLLFFPHRLLSEADLPETRQWRALDDKFRKLMLTGRVRLRHVLAELEGNAPAGRKAVERDERGVITAVALNTEYPHQKPGGIPEVPCRAWAHRISSILQYAKAVHLLFRLLRTQSELAPYLATYRGEPLRGL